MLTWWRRRRELNELGRITFGLPRKWFESNARYRLRLQKRLIIILRDET